MVHDAHLIHDVQREGWHAAQMASAVEGVDKQATALFKATLAGHFADPPKEPRRGGGGRRGGKGKGRARGRLLGGKRQQAAERAPS